MHMLLSSDNSEPTPAGRALIGKATTRNGEAKVTEPSPLELPTRTIITRIRGHTPPRLTGDALSLEAGRQINCKTPQRVGYGTGQTRTNECTTIMSVMGALVGVVVPPSGWRRRRE